MHEHMKQVLWGVTLPQKPPKDLDELQVEAFICPPHFALGNANVQMGMALLLLQ